MSDNGMKTAVAFIIFNRPDTTARVFERIRQARPQKLLVVADGPRSDRPGEAERCEAARAVIETVDWDCEVLTNYSGENMGCRRRVSSGLDWVFEKVEEAIILEDDCLPHPAFFRFCEELLERYRDDERVAMVSGDNYQAGQRRGQHSYYFSVYTHIWGWATWRRAWRYNDMVMGRWPEVRDGGLLLDLFGDPRAARYWADGFEKAYHREVNAWSYYWLFTCWSRGFLTVLPNVNLISNIGFGAGGTHTEGESRLADMPVEDMPFPLSHPAEVARDYRADEFTEKALFSGYRLPLHKRVAGGIRRLLGRPAGRVKTGGGSLV